MGIFPGTGVVLNAAAATAEDSVGCHCGWKRQVSVYYIHAEFCDKCIQSCNRYHNQDTALFTHPKEFLHTLLQSILSPDPTQAKTDLFSVSIVLSRTSYKGNSTIYSLWSLAFLT